jgi:hypothetical protein
MKYVGNNSYLKNMIYTSLGPDMHLYVKSSNPQFLHLKKLRMSAVFEDFDAASKLLCDGEGNTAVCDVMDMEFPIRSHLVPMLIELVVKEITNAAYKPSDTANNSSDDLSDMTAWVRRNMKSGLQRQIEG